MNVFLLRRATPALLTSAMLACGVVSTGFAQTSPPVGPTTSSSPAGSASATGTMGTSHSTTPSAAEMNSRQGRAVGPGQTMQTMVEQRLADLHSKLHITPQEAGPWGQFATVMRDNAKNLDSLYQARAEKMGSMTAVHNMQSYVQIEQTRAQDVQKLSPAFQTFYGSLSEQQKREADQRFRNKAQNAQQRRQNAAAR